MLKKKTYLLWKAKTKHMIAKDYSCDCFVTAVSKNVPSLCVIPCVLKSTEVSKEGLVCNIEVEK